MNLFLDLQKNEQTLDYLVNIGEAFDINKTPFIIDNQANIIYYDEFLINSINVINVLEGLKSNWTVDNYNYFQKIKQKLPCLGIKEENTFEELVNAILSGNLVILIANFDIALVVDLKTYPSRGIQDADNEKVVRGSKESFTENLSTNVALVRKRIKSPDLRIEKYQIGEYSKTTIAVIYLNSKVNKKALSNAIKRLKAIKVEELTMTDKALEELLSTRPYSPYPMVRYTERPDTLVIHLYQGQFGIVVDTSPSVMLAPTTIFDHLQAPEEYRQTALCGTFLRILRFLGIVVSFLLVPLWLALVNTISIDNGLFKNVFLVEDTKINILIQIILSEIAVELVKMASIHTPNSLSTSMGLIVGIVLGGIAVDLGIISQTVVLLAALSAIGSYITPSYELALANKIIKLLFIVASYFFGLIGLGLSIILFFCYLLSLRSFGESYLKPLIPFNGKALLKQFIRVPYKNKN